MSEPISNRCPGCRVEYTYKNDTRVTRHFKNAYLARSFYVCQDKLGTNPKVLKELTMTDSTPESTTVDNPQSQPKLSAKKPATARKPVKKTTKKTVKKSAKKPAKGKAPITNGKAEGNTLTEIQINTLKYLIQKGESSRSEIRSGTSAKFLGIPKMLERKLVKQLDREGYRGDVFSITPEGRKELKKQK